MTKVIFFSSKRPLNGLIGGNVPHMREELARKIVADVQNDVDPNE